MFAVTECTPFVDQQLICALAVKQNLLTAGGYHGPESRQSQVFGNSH